ncbi:MAG: DUF1788 domain-containing protein [Candidatus Riflebacteria bacterium]|nr:DUF1788 domain-containing protein [Candidatus Riflebacteria bacterium]
MSRIKKLLHSFSTFVAIPWKSDAAAAQRVIFCVYNEADELRLRAHIDEFEIATKQAGHEWHLFDLTDTFPNWLTSQRYAKQYFEKPALLGTLLHKYLDFLSAEFTSFLEKKSASPDSIVALTGVGSLFGFLKVKDVVDKFAPSVKGRLLVFFPGNYENNNYRLLDGYDGWNYLAVPITANQEF